ncbi:hypothetical protein, partial [Porphyromonas gingivalis]|uniref:hypothetical protein n=1 Tax=Porphyromonas gingivalis TaxID=837 RepID=UPI001F2101AC
LEIRYKYTKCKLHEQRKTSLIFRRLNILSRISDKSKCDCPDLAESLIAFCEKLISVYFFSVDERKRNKGILKKI